MADDFLEAVVDMEATFHQRGIDDGQRFGREKGLAEGNCMGMTKGGEVGLEVGFYFGTVKMWLSLAAVQPALFPFRKLSKVTRLLELLEDLDVFDPRSDIAVEKLHLIRARYKAVLSQLSLHQYFNKQDSDSTMSL
eukprot:CAMPEP_0175093562 /NCGR_PEP_ID=MMETSP0086_2-20121207/3090_1 /TAXON_ID=136419 /ORGANISM="Unknown Unknown, Strain D1" /LENGTH=135 /DNA_ID=CAMNT_0016366555 /DNA_START=48 /DNA_END=455 /DNA_ORIENTATION=+